MQANKPWRQIGSDVRWFLGGEDRLFDLLNETLGAAEAESRLASALAATTSARQLAIRHCLRDGVHQAFAPSDGSQRQRVEIRRAIEEVTGVSDGQANRILNGLGLFAFELEGGTMELARRYVQGSRQIAREIDVELLLMLTVGASERLEQFILRPYQFVANTASTLLRLRIATDAAEQSDLDSALDQREKYPMIRSNAYTTQNFDRPSPLAEMTAIARMAIYGMYQWQTGSLRFVENESDLNSAQIRNMIAARTIRLSHTEAPWLFPEFQKHPNLLMKACEDERYLRTVLQAVDEISTVVGQAVCGDAPYCATVEAGD